MDSVYNIEPTQIEETLFGMMDSKSHIREKIYYDNLIGFIEELNDLEWNNL